MLRRTVIFLLIIFVGLNGVNQYAIAGEDSEKEKNLIQEGGLNLHASTSGMGIGGFYNREFKKDFFGVSAFDIILINDDKEFKVYDYYTNQQYTANNPNNVILLSMTFGVKQRLFRDSIEPSLRPFIKAGGGPIFGMNFPNNTDDYGYPLSNPRDNQFMWTGTVFGSVGADFGSSETSLVTVEFRFNYMRFAETLGQKKEYKGIAFGFGFGIQF